MSPRPHDTAPTIFALATPPGRSGVAVLRVSGAAAFESLRDLTGRDVFAPRRAVLHTIKHPGTGRAIDTALILPFAAPGSFTGEDCVEYHLHGGPAIIKMMLEILGQRPHHRMAEPGEFTRRAFENGKMDLTAAEGIADLIDAETELQQAQALAQMGGALAALYEGWADRLTRALAHLEADLDFPDEDLPDGVASQVMPVLQGLSCDIAAHLKDARRGERLRDGFQVVIVGAPNVGKSSLLNALARRDVAIVSDMAGTTRDPIEVHLNLGGYPVILVDTAGLRPEQLGDSGQDKIESEGIRRAVERARDADLTILLEDGSAPSPENQALAALRDDRSLVVFNKSDRVVGARGPGLWISTKTGDGLDTLCTTIISRIETLFAPRTAPGPTRARHRVALEECSAALMRAQQAVLPELMAEDVRLAIRALGRITGRVDVEDLLDIIFRDFCIGK
jgi:tRNA modification GTPase